MPKAPRSSVETFLARLPPARAVELARVHDVVRSHLPPGYQEVVQGSVAEAARRR